MSEKDKTIARLEATAACLDLVIPEACLPGVVANTQLLQGYVDLICGMELPDNCLTACEYRP